MSAQLVMGQSVRHGQAGKWEYLARAKNVAVAEPMRLSAHRPPTRVMPQRAQALREARGPSLVEVNGEAEGRLIDERGEQPGFARTDCVSDITRVHCSGHRDLKVVPISLVSPERVLLGWRCP